MQAPTWKHTALFVTYDEHGGYYDHVPPPRAIKPDSIAPILAPGDARGATTVMASGVPLVAVSPWAKPGYVSRITARPDIADRVHRAQVEPAGHDLP